MDRRERRQWLEGLVGVGNVDERVVEDLWPQGLMEVRAGAVRDAALVVRPPDVESVSKLLRWASTEGVTVTALGGGSGVCGALNRTADEVVVDLGALTAFEVDEADLVVRAQAGVIGLVLEEALNRRGLTLGHFPSSLPVATLGGLVATRSSGQQSSYHGSIEDLVLGLTVALPDGSLLHPRRPARSAVGPALQELFIGSEGALGIILEVVLGVRRLPAAGSGRGVSFATLGAGLAAMREVLQRDLRPLVLRLYDAEDTAFQGSAAAGCLLLVAVAGEPEVTKAQERVLDRLLAAGSPLGEGPWETWLEHRFRLSAERLKESLVAPGSFLDTIEVAGPWSILEALHAEVKAGIGSEMVTLCHFSHATPQGCCAYFTFAGSAPTEDAAADAHRSAWRFVMGACARHGATIGHHHGAGRARAPWIEQEMGEWLEVWKAVRSALDPDGIMNPRALGGRP